MTTTEEKWVERIQRWQESGKTAEEFALGQPYKASTLKWRAADLRRHAEGGPRYGKASARSKSIRMAEVVVRRGTSQGTAVSSSGLAVEVSGVRIMVSRGFDAALFADVVRVLASGVTR